MVEEKCQAEAPWWHRYLFPQTARNTRLQVATLSWLNGAEESGVYVSGCVCTSSNSGLLFVLIVESGTRL